MLDDKKWSADDSSKSLLINQRLFQGLKLITYYPMGGRSTVPFRCSDSKVVQNRLYINK